MDLILSHILEITFQRKPVVQWYPGIFQGDFSWPECNDPIRVTFKLHQGSNVLNKYSYKLLDLESGTKTKPKDRV